MITVNVEVNNKFYPISCKIGEEDRVIASGKLLSEIISTLDDNENGPEAISTFFFRFSPFLIKELINWEYSVEVFP